MAYAANGEFSALTMRQLEVLKLISLGLQMKQVGSRLCIAPDTVKNTMIEVFNRLDVRTAAGAVGEAYRRGLLIVDADAVSNEVSAAVRRVLQARVDAAQARLDLLYG